MQIDCYNNYSANNVVTKDIRYLKSYNVNMKENTDMLNPTFIVKESMSNVANINYLYCSQFRRYYYVISCECGVGGVLLIHCKSDPLMSFQNEIRTCGAMVTRQQNIKDMDIVDPKLLIKAPHQIYTQNFSNTPFNNSANSNIVLTCTGGVTVSTTSKTNESEVV